MSAISNIINAANWSGLGDLAFTTPQVYSTIDYSAIEPRRNTVKTALDIGGGIFDTGRSILGGANPVNVVGSVFTTAAQGIFQGIMERKERKETRPARQQAMNEEVSFYFGRNIGTNDAWLTGLGSHIADWVANNTQFWKSGENEISLKPAAMRGNQNPQVKTIKISDLLPGYVPGKAPETSAPAPQASAPPEELYEYARESFEPVYSVGFGRQTSVMATAGRFNDPVFGNPVISFLGSKFA